MKRAGQGLLVLVLAGTLLSLLAQRTEGTSTEKDYTAPFNKTWAKAAFSAFCSSFWDAKLNYLLDQYPDPSGTLGLFFSSLSFFVLSFFALSHSCSKLVGAGRQTAYWTAAQGLDTLIDAALLYPDDHTIIDLIYDFVQTQDKIGLVPPSMSVGARNANRSLSLGWRRDYYDDENWMAMALVRAFEVTKDQRFLNQAVKLWEDISGAWDTSCCGPVKGSAKLKEGRVRVFAQLNRCRWAVVG